ncbi:MAG TPA: polysaccharide deacetylase family protein [Solirubrobacteraceae bacterium]|jgi:peptidoglycan/xylan/chitin deacetylase (PgdA/CDA1 family)|nr:polysaccharide deacetylase family protein [Solirubrobacteraceae bacterium]
MAPRWKWDFEDERASVRKPAPVAPSPPLQASPANARVRIRRRRAGAGAGLLLLLALVLVTLSGGGGKSTAHRASSKRTPATAKAATPPPTPAQEKQAEEKAVSSVLAYTPFVREGGSRGHDIALTFDDGPGPYTPQVLSVLERYHVRATFFVIGKMLQYFSESTVREIRDGDVIGDHTETHPMLATLSAHDQHEELFEQIARIELLDGPRPVLFRPPYGSFDATTLRELHEMHLLMVLWSVDTDDYQQPGVEAIVQSALTGAHPGAIILMHDAGGVRTQTIAALPLIIAKLRARGYHLVTVPQLLEDDPPPAGQPVPPNLSGD